MTRLSEVRGRDRALCFLYGASALIGLIVMGWMAVAFVVQNADAGALGVVENFLRDSTTNLATRFVYMDLVLTWAAVGAYMIVESRRFGIRHVWAYIVGAPAIALIVTYGLFMLVRQLKIAALREAEGAQAGGERALAAEEFTDRSAPRSLSATGSQ
ncbi:DUF2834 domain-containing protein [Streptomyces sp. NBC_00193]|uniref:DUF2834 domain-containing protein n=1 Tax=unclassified Streptomyces TaxID=2593676 RepID=UPI002252CAE9|nr:MULTISPECIES: DUF2834 domain-containing protein [unclassified Streptomyces]MCX5127845.1 DUF2834 domain-containing protein [Streptomyces sp. NBC_00347]MCX5301489.1 DUF2834 domain-containing protein [Streptomyces sp. NBC_00193]